MFLTPLRRGVKQQLLDTHAKRLLASHFSSKAKRYGSSHVYPTSELHRKLTNSKWSKGQENVETRISKTLSFLLRHGAGREHLPMREDGYVAVKDIVSPP
jgi:RNA 2'-phosphotransferase, Tpt1 / KptA family